MKQLRSAVLAGALLIVQALLVAVPYAASLALFGSAAHGAPHAGKPGGGGSRPARAAAPSLESALRARFARAPLRSARTGALVVSLVDGRTLFRQGENVPLVPASTMKLMVSAAALERLGPDWRHETRLLAAAPPRDGVLAGDLFVEGGGAPDLVVERLPEFAEALRDAGVRHITGDVVADVGYFDGEDRPPEWPDGSPRNLYASPIAALAANFGTVRVRVSPGDRVGASAHVLVEPPSEAVALSGRVRTTSGGRAISATRTLDRSRAGEPKNRILLSGRIGIHSAPWERFLVIEDPAFVAASMVKAALQGEGIVVEGGSRVGTAPPGAAPLTALRSRPLSELVSDMNKASNNFMAEMLQRTLGAETRGRPGSRAKGAEAIEAFLRACGVDPAPLVLTDGSGLSRSNRLTATALVRVLIRMASDPLLAPAFVGSLPVGGVDGTLRARMSGAAQGRVRAKTGRVNGVTTLAGYVDDASEGPIAFAFLVNGASHARAAAALDELCRILCTPRPVAPLRASTPDRASRRESSPGP